MSLGTVTADIAFTNALVIGSVGRTGRETVHTDAIEAQVVCGQWQPPQAGTKVTTPEAEESVWEPLAASADGWFQHRAFRGGYAFVSCTLPEARVMLLEAAGHSTVYVNGEPRAGDPYAYGYLRLPVGLRAGTNEFLFHVGRGRLRVQLTDAKAEAQINPSDTTLPDFIVGERQPAWASVVVVNASTNPAAGLFLRIAGEKDRPDRRFPVDMGPLTARKVPFRLRPPTTTEPSEHSFNLQLVRAERGLETVLDTVPLKVGIRQPNQLHRRTFLSRQDGSVQYYAVNPPPTPCDSPALFLSLHGAGVEGVGQAASYAPKSWGLIVSPTNRRPFGFDWEEWGRWDALEVLRLAQDRYGTDPARTYLTGHSMGGHGTWLLGATFPDQFAAIGPSAGWISFRTYARGGGPPETDSPMQEMLRRAAASSDTLNLVSNYLHQAVYILHGDADDNVRVDQARTMRKHLETFHADFAWHEQPGAGHWWDASDEPGTDCVDWAPMFDLFARHRLPATDETRTVRFTTVNPGVSSRCRWLSVEAQIHNLQPSHVSARRDPGHRRIVAQTLNVARLAFALESVFPAGDPIQVELDGQKLGDLAWPAKTTPAVRGVAAESPRLLFERADEHWRLADNVNPADKNPLRYGPFREAFNQGMLFVYGTQGTPAENAWALAKARYDAESFGYRGNGSVEIMADSDFLAHPQRAAHPFERPGRRRNVILYGHADANAAWASLLGTSPVQVRRGVATIGSHEYPGDSLGVLFLRPHPHDPQALVGVIAGSGLPGLRLTERLPVFLAGPGLPDCLLVHTDMLTRGLPGVRAAGFFGLDWSVEQGDFVWAAE